MQVLLEWCDGECQREWVDLSSSQAVYSEHNLLWARRVEQQRAVAWPAKVGVAYIYISLSLSLSLSLSVCAVGCSAASCPLSVVCMFVFTYTCSTTWYIAVLCPLMSTLLL